MKIVFSDTFWPSTVKLSATERGQIPTFINKLQGDPSLPGLRLERIQHIRHCNLWSARVTQDLRAILHREGDETALLFAGHHDDAYAWAERRRAERHCVTGALQIVESVEASEPAAAAYAARPAARPLLDLYADETLLALGVPDSWLPTLRRITDDKELLEVLSHLPGEAADALLQLAAGESVRPAPVTPPSASITEHPDARRRFTVIASDGELQRMLDAPLATWLAYLHPSQQRLVEGQYNGPVKVTGAAGTGKSVVAVHRARFLARQGKRVLLTTFVKTLADALDRSLSMLCNSAERQLITVATVHSQAARLASGIDRFRQPRGNEIATIVEQIHSGTPCALSSSALVSEWQQVVQAQGIDTREAYRAAERQGLGPLTASERERVWDVLGQVRAWCLAQSPRVRDYPDQCRRARLLLEAGRVVSPFDAVIVDEMQDCGPQELLFLAALAGTGRDRLMLLGDEGQRIYGRSFSLNGLGIAVRGRSHVLRVNYRTTEQIRRWTDRLRDGHVEPDGEGDEPDARSLLQGFTPIVRGFATASDQYRWIAHTIRVTLTHGFQAEEIALFARSNQLLHSAQQALAAEGIETQILQRESNGTTSNSAAVWLGTMHRAKGLEYKVVFVIDVNLGVVPIAASWSVRRTREEREEAMSTERRIFYTAATRARDQLFVTWTDVKSPFLDLADSSTGHDSLADARYLSTEELALEIGA